MNFRYLIPLIFIFSCSQDSKNHSDHVVSSKETTNQTQVALAHQNTSTVHSLSPQVEANFMYLQEIQIPSYKNGRFEIVKHKIKPNETLKSLSNSYSVHIEDIIANNPELTGKLKPFTAENRESYLMAKANPQKTPRILMDNNDIQKQIKQLKQSSSRSKITKNNQSFDIELGKDIESLYALFEKQQLQERTYTDEKGLHKVISITLTQEKTPSIEVFGLQKVNDQKATIKKVVIKDPALEVNQLHVGTTIKELQDQYTSPNISVIQNSVVIFPERSEPVALVLEGFSMDWKPDGNYTLQDIPDHVKVKSIQLF